MIPLYGEMSFADIAAKLDLPEYRVHRILRHAMTFRIFRERRPGYVAHTGPSAAFLKNPLLSDWVSFNLDEVWPADTKLAQALRRYGDSEEPGDSAVGLAYSFPKDKTYWDFVANDGEGENKGWRQKRFAQAMKYVAGGNPHAHHHLHAAFDWAALGKATVADVSDPRPQRLLVGLIRLCTGRWLHWPCFDRVGQSLSPAAIRCPRLCVAGIFPGNCAR